MVALVIVCASCSTFKQVKERQTTHAEAELAVVPDTVFAAVLAVLPEFDLIETARYDTARFVQAQGDWDSDQEGGLVQISVKVIDGHSQLVVEAGNSSFDTNEQKLKLARAIVARVRQQLGAARD